LPSAPNLSFFLLAHFSLSPVTYQNLEGQKFEDQNFEGDKDSSLESARISTEMSPRRQSGWSDGLVSGPKGLLLGLMMGLGLAFVGAQISGREPAAEVAPGAMEAQVASASVTTVKAQRSPIQATIAANGTVEAFDLLSVAPRASGLQIEAVTVREGDRVTQGQVLAVLDDSVLRAQIQQAEAQVVSTQAQVAQAQARVAQDEAEAAEADNSYERYVSLFSQGAISEEALEARRTELTTAQQSISSSIAAVDSAEATVRSAQAEVERLMTQLSQTEVLAPASGVIAEKNATLGDMASTGSPLFTLISGDQLELAMTVPQTQLAKVNPGASVQITASSDPNLQLQGSVRTIDPVVNAQSRKATVKVSLPDSDRLRPGMFLQANIVTGSRQGVVVPAEAVLPQSDGSFVVYTLEAGTAKANTVAIGDRIPAKGVAPAQAEVISGLAPDAVVIVEGASYIQDGDSVDVVSSPFTS